MQSSFSEILKCNYKELTSETFFGSYIRSQMPVVIKGIADNWPALQSWTTEYFERNYGNVNCGFFHLKNNVSELNTQRGSRLDYVSLEQCISLIENPSENAGVSIATPIEVFDNSLRNDFETPELCKGKAFLRTRLFISPTDAITTLHQDIFDNLYVVLKGEKTILLFPPSSPVYANSRFSKLPNHAQVDPENPDYIKYPKFREAKGYRINLKAGECLYIPSLWWHYLHTRETTIALSFWWTEGWMTPIARIAAWYKKVRNI